LVARPAIDELSDRIRQRKARSGTRLDTGDILSARDQDRR
jgi:hypothetical protein